MLLVRQICLMVLLSGAWVTASSAQNQPASPINLLDHLAGRWVLRGTIAGKPTTHDVEATWVLRREYLRLHESSREKDGSGQPAYEAIIFISWDSKAKQYSCLWLDSTAGGGLSADTICRAKPAGRSIPFIFTIAGSDQIHTTFSYDQDSDSWKWLIDNVENGRAQTFARVTLTRAR